MLAGQFPSSSNELPLVAFVRLTLGPAVCAASLVLCTLALGEPYTWLYGVLALVTFLVAARVFGELALAGGESLLVPRRGIIFDWIKVCAVLLFVGFVTKYSGLYSRKVLLTWFIVTPFLLQGAQAAARRLLQSAVVLGDVPRKVIVGVDEVGRELARRMREDPCQGIMKGFFDDRRERLSGVKPEELLGGLKDVAGYLKEHGVNGVYIALPMSRDPRLLRLLDELRDTTASIYFVPRAGFDLRQARLGRVGEVPVIALRETPFFGIRGGMKRAVDVLISLLGLVLLAPLMLAIAAAVKWTSPGPVLCAQRRCGLDGKPISIYGFRTTTVCEDPAAAALLHDTRVTRVGALLRRTSLDALPRLMNVLEGSMSIVGPRCHTPARNEECLRIINANMLRYKVRPGMTGWAQINGFGGETERGDKVEQRIRYELDYLKHWSLSLDLWIIFRTACAVFGRRSVY